MPTLQCRNYTLTLFDSEETLRKLWSSWTMLEPVVFMAGQMEMCPTSQRIHLQAYLQLRGKHSIRAMKTLLTTNTVHLERAKGTPQENLLYVSKEESRHASLPSHGTMKKTGHECKQLQTRDLLREIRMGKSEMFLAEKYSTKWLCYRRTLLDYRRLCVQSERHWKTKVIWYWGPTGSGKTRLAHIITHKKAWVASDNTGRWFDGYEHHRDVIFDDVDCTEKLDRSLLLRLIDRYPMTVPVKGSFVDWVPKRVIFTSNFHWSLVFGQDAAIERRIEECIRLE